MAAWDAVRRPRKPSSRWTKGLSCTNNQTAPLNGGRPIGPMPNPPYLGDLIRESISTQPVGASGHERTHGTVRLQHARRALTTRPEPFRNSLDCLVPTRRGPATPASHQHRVPGNHRHSLAPNKDIPCARAMGRENRFEGRRSSTGGAYGQRQAIPRRAGAAQNDPAESPNHKE